MTLFKQIWPGLGDVCVGIGLLYLALTQLELTRVRRYFSWFWRLGHWPGTVNRISPAILGLLFLLLGIWGFYTKMLLLK